MVNVDETISSGIGAATSCIAVESIGKDNYVKVMTGLGAIIGGALGYMMCALPDTSELDTPDPLLCAIGGAVFAGALSAGGSYVTGSACEVINPYVKEKLKVKES